MFDLNNKSYLILSWNLNSLRKLFLNNINYAYTYIVDYRMSTTTKENIDNRLIVGCIFLLLEYSRKKDFVALVFHVINQIMNG
jgi:hypothetical protein